MRTYSLSLLSFRSFARRDFDPTLCSLIYLIVLPPFPFLLALSRRKAISLGKRGLLCLWERFETFGWCFPLHLLRHQNTVTTRLKGCSKKPQTQTYMTKFWSKPKKEKKYLELIKSWLEVKEMPKIFLLNFFFSIYLTVYFNNNVVFTN